MENDTLKGRASRLMQRCRRAVRLYSDASKKQGSSYNEVQLGEWRDINQHLYERLHQIVTKTNPKILSYSLFAIRNEMCGQMRDEESDVACKQRELISAAERGEYSRCASLSNTLVKSAARFQALTAALNEIDGVLEGVRLSSSPEENVAEFERQKTVFETDENDAFSKVVPFRRIK